MAGAPSAGRFAPPPPRGRESVVALQDGAGLGGRLRGRHPRGEPAEGAEGDHRDREPPRRVEGGRGERRNHERHPELAVRVREVEPLGEHPDHGAGVAAEVDGGADDVGVRSEPVDPGAVAEQHHPVGPRPALLVGEEAAEVGGRPQQREERRRHPRPAQGDGAVGARPVDRGGPVGGELLERSRVVLEQGHRTVREKRARPSPERLADAHDRLGVRPGQRPQQDAVDDAEHRGVGADAEGEGRDRGEGERALPRELADGVAEVSKERVHDACLSYRRRSSVREPAGAAGLVPRGRSVVASVPDSH